MSDVIYLYGFLPADAPEPPADLRGIADARVRVLELGELQAAISHLPASAMDPATLDQRLTDLAWVGEQGLAHERVVLWFVDHSEIIPARLLTLHTSVAGLRAGVQPQLPEVAATLRDLAGRREWNLKVAYDAAVLADHAAEVSAEVASADAAIAAAAPGRRYLLQRSRAETVRRELAGAARRLAAELFDRLAAFADRTRLLPLAETDRGGNVVLNAALLVDRERESALREAAEAAAAQQRSLGMIVSFSGPWAPYRFVEQHEEH